MQGASLKKTLNRSLERQRRLLTASMILTPVDSIPLWYGEQEAAAFLHGLYISDKQRTLDQKQRSIIQFPGRDRATRDLNLIHRQLVQMLGGAEGSLRLLSGLHAHIAIFMSLAAIGDEIILLPEQAGGHFATKGILERLGLHVTEMPIDFGLRCVDRQATLALIQRLKPNFIFVDRSEGLRYEDFQFLGELRGPVKVFDASHYLPQIMCGMYENPFKWGFDLLVFSLHKSFPGPQKAGVIARESNDLWQKLLNGLGELVSSSHTENSYRVGLALGSDCELQEYTSRLMDTALALEDSLCHAGLPMFPRCQQGRPEWPPTHHIWLPLESSERAFSLHRDLARCRIHTNYRLLPYNLGWGLRMGTTAAVMCGLSRDTIEELAHIITDGYHHGFSLPLRHRVRQLLIHIHPRALSRWPYRLNQ